MEELITVTVKPSEHPEHEAVLKLDEMKRASAVLRACVEDLPDQKTQQQLVILLDGLSSAGVCLFLDCLQKEEEEDDIIGSRIFKDLEASDRVALYRAFDKYDVERGLRAMDAQLRSSLQAYHVLPTALASAYEWHPRIVSIITTLADDAMVPDHPDAKAMQLIFERKVADGLRCALMMGGRKGLDDTVEYGFVNVVVRIPDKGGCDDAEYLPGGHTGYWLRKYCDRELMLGWMVRRDGVWDDCTASEAPHMKWLVIAFPGMWYGGGMWFTPKEPAEWISEDFGCGYDSDDSGSFIGGDTEDKAERVCVMPTAEDVWRFLAESGPTQLIINHDGQVVHRSWEVKDTDLQDSMVSHE